MTIDERPDPLFELLVDLPVVAPAEASQHRVLARCHAELAHHRSEAVHRRRAWVLLDATAFCAVALYLAGVLALALQLA